MSKRNNKRSRLFDDWPEKYDKWFETPIGALVKIYESELLLDMLGPDQGEIILDMGCGTGVFTIDILSFGPHVIGLDISQPMVIRACHKAKKYPFSGIVGDMMSLPFADDSFDKVVSMTAIEFVKDAQRAVKELFRVTRRGGRIVVTTLNSLSPWAARRMDEAKKGPSIFEKTIFRSPDEIRSIVPVSAVIKTAIYFGKDDDPGEAHGIEREGRKKGLMTGAFLAARWEKP
jgi:ubiquinone/menaquinone biosynthesis C-methylase UbiE